jgi:hypothetical protein
MSCRAFAGFMVGAALLLPRAASAQALGQTAAPIRLVAFTNEPREPEFGEVFELYLQLRMAPNLVAFIPDTLLPAPDAFNAAPGTWTTEAGPADSIDVRATYYVMGVMNGGVELPTLELLTGDHEVLVAVRILGGEAVASLQIDLEAAAVATALDEARLLLGQVAAVDSEDELPDPGDRRWPR